MTHICVTRPQYVNKSVTWWKSVDPWTNVLRVFVTVHHWTRMVVNSPEDTLRNNDIVITSKRRHFDVITSKWRRFDVTTTLSLRHVFSREWSRTLYCHREPHNGACQSPWWRILDILSWYPVMSSSLCNSFEDRVPGCPIFKWVAMTWLNDRIPV